MIKVLLSDDHKMFIDGMISFLKDAPDITIIGEALNGNEVVKKMENNEVDVVVLDIEMPEMNGIETTKYIRKHHPEVKVLILSMYNTKDFIYQLMQAGVNGYILKNKSKEELVGAIRNVHRGQPHFGLEVLTMATSTKPILEIEVELTSREKEVLSLIGEGHTTKEITGKLYISEPTVNTHRRNLLRKLDLPNDKHLVRYAIKHGYVTL